MSSLDTQKPPAPTRRSMNAALAVAWSAVALCGGAALMMLQEFLAPKAAKEPRKLWRIGRLEDYSATGVVYEQFKRNPDGSAGFWVVNLAAEKKLVALSATCTHLACPPNWMPADSLFRCPCHGSVYRPDGVNCEGPAPRPLERYGISREPDGSITVDQSKVYRQELGQWENPGSFVSLG